MGAREQFAGWGFYDNQAICLSCKTHHLIPMQEQVTTQPWLDWLKKHEGHVTFIVPNSQLGNLNALLQLERAQEVGLPLPVGLKHNANVKIEYAASAPYTITLTSLASGSTLLAGREGNSLSNATNKYLDELVSALITTGTTPTAGAIEVHVVGALDDTPTWPDVFDGTDSTETITSADIKASCCAMVGGVNNSTTSNVGYPIRPLGIRQLFGDGLPPAHVPFVTHSTVAALNATASLHFVKHTPIYATVV